MRATLSIGLFLALGLSAFLGACGDKLDGAGDGPQCSNSADCAAGNECSAGSCVAVVTCSSDTACADGQKCESGACRTACDSDADCAALGLICNEASSLCLPDSNSPAGTGGTTSGTGGTTSGTGGSTSTASSDVIDDLEDGDVRILESESRVGYWYSYNEDSPRPRMPVSAVVDDGGSKVLHAAGSHKSGVASDSAYGGLGVDLNNADPNQQGPLSSSREAYDASAWDGFQFRVKSSVTKSIRFEIVTTAVATPAEGGDCSSGTCFDSFGMDVVLSDSWSTVKVPYSALVQEGWGDVKSFDPSTILGVAFEDLTTNDWDFYVDDLAFYMESETETPTDPGDPGNPGGGDPTCSGSWGAESNGSITWYTFSQGTAAIGDVNCSYGISQNPDKVNHVATGAGQYFGAINTTDYATAAACGACVEVSRGTKKVVVTIVDQCPVSSNPKCVKGHIDLSKSAFLQLGTESEGYIGQRAGNDSITWKYVPCTTTAKVSARLKEPSNVYWNAVLVEDHVYPIQSVQVKVGSDWLNASRSEYNYWLPPGGRMGTSPYSLRITDVNGSIIETTVALTSGDQSSGKQFTCE